MSNMIDINEDQIEYIAEFVHTVNKKYCLALGDDSQPDWIDAPDWQKESAINGVIFKFENANTTPAELHENWMKVKLEGGWVYGEVKDPEKKTHPCMVPYEELPEHQKFKDFLFSMSIVNALSVISD